MKRTILCLLILLPSLIHAQPRIKNKKYQGLLWEISGNGLSKTSYLFGTMHVSSKMAFHLADSFYLGIRNADVVALETNPESWQEDMSRYDLSEERGYPQGVPDQFFVISDLRFYPYAEKIQRALSSNPSSINNLLYRTYGNESSDFEEDTYLDMYIYQCGKRWGKQVAGVERYAESMRLMSEAYKDAAKEKVRKTRGDVDDDYGASRLQEAYRAGNLDWLDSINRANSTSDAFDEKFLYRRNQIQASSIDSILHTGKSLFVGVGAAHLPGTRGVIEILRRQGYTLRPVKMGARDSDHKTQVEKLRVPVTFHQESAADGLYKVEIPGKFYQFGDDNNSSARQYADMANGSYYMVSRIMTNAWMWGDSPARVRAVVDSLLYENIPGRIIKKTNITRNGIDGIDIVNRTRRGDMQRYHIFITPFEVVVFKMSGTGDYVTLGTEADRFFNSIVLKNYVTAAPLNGGPVKSSGPAQWNFFSPGTGGFRVRMPHTPYNGNDGSMIYDAMDPATGNHFRVIRTDVPNYNFVGEDSFDLSLMEESFGASAFIGKKMTSTSALFQGYPSRDVTYTDKSGGTYVVRFVIHGPQYYTVVAHLTGEPTGNVAASFLNSFELLPYTYPPSVPQRDTSLFFTAKWPVFKDSSAVKLSLPGGEYGGSGYGDDEDESNGAAYQSRMIRNDSTGEMLFVSYYRLSEYDQLPDTNAMAFTKQLERFNDYDSSIVIRSSTTVYTGNNGRVEDAVIGSKTSSRVLRVRFIFRDGNGFVLMSESDTVNAGSTFIRDFYDSFQPFDSLRRIDAFSSKTMRFTDDFLSTDSGIHKRAVKALPRMKFREPADLQQLKRLIGAVTWKEPGYLDLKKTLITRVAGIDTKDATDYLKQLYANTGDTLDLQHAVLTAMVSQQTDYAIHAFRDIMVSEPPVLEVETSGSYDSYNYRGGVGSSFMSILEDSLQLTRTILPDLLPLMNLDDYKPGILRLLAATVDSGLVKPKVYKDYFSTLQLAARQLLKKQVISEKQRQIEKDLKAADSEADNSTAGVDFLSSASPGSNEGNTDLSSYVSLLMPFYDTKESVRTFMSQVLGSQDDRLRYTTLLQLLTAGKPYPDSILGYFASKDRFSYELYRDLSDLGIPDKFPAAYRQQSRLVRSQLVFLNSYVNIDTLVLLDKLPATVRGQTGLVWFYKYKKNKSDANWKIASVGLVPSDSTKLSFAASRHGNGAGDDYDQDYSDNYDEDSAGNDLTELGDTRYREEQNLNDQLSRILKRMVYSTHPSGRRFYGTRTEEESGDEDSTDEPTEDRMDVPKGEVEIKKIPGN